MIRGLVALAGSLCMLLHVGLVGLHHAVPREESQATTQFAGRALEPIGLMQALVASMCRPQALVGGDGAPAIPNTPRHRNSPPCVICCCPIAAAPLLPVMASLEEPSPVRLIDCVTWSGHGVLVAARTAERPPVRGPPAPA